MNTTKRVPVLETEGDLSLVAEVSVDSGTPITVLMYEDGGWVENIKCGTRDALRYWDPRCVGEADEESVLSGMSGVIEHPRADDVLMIQLLD